MDTLSWDNYGGLIMVDSETVEALERRVRSIEVIVRMFALAILASAWGLCQRALNEASKHEQIATEMLGGDELPALTSLVFTFARLGWIALAIPIVVFLVGVVGAIKLTTKPGLITYAFCLLALAGSWWIMREAYQQPLVKIIQGIAGP